MERTGTPTQPKTKEERVKLDDTESMTERDSAVSAQANGEVPLEQIQTTCSEKTDLKAPVGIKLHILFAAIFFSVFLMALNGSIVSTVSLTHLINIPTLDKSGSKLFEAGNSEDNFSLQLP